MQKQAYRNPYLKRVHTYQRLPSTVRTSIDYSDRSLLSRFFFPLMFLCMGILVSTHAAADCPKNAFDGGTIADGAPNGGTTTTTSGTTVGH